MDKFNEWVDPEDLLEVGQTMNEVLEKKVNFKIIRKL